MAPEESVPCEDFATCGAAQFQNKNFPKNVKQQDSYFVVEDMANTFGVRLGGIDRVALYGVVDGHGECGEVCAAFVRRHLPTQLAQSRHFSEGQLESALVEAFVQTDLLQQSAGLPLWASGACVTAAAVTPTSIVVANCGDCRCVLAEQGAAHDLSSDHNVQSATPEERRRVLAAGGSFTADNRVTTGGAPGRLATTRSLGDYWAKPQGPAEGHIVSGLPEIRTIMRRPGQQFLLLASDGIFGFMSSQEVVSLPRPCEFAEEAKPTVLLFYCSDCPTSKRAMDELQKLSTSAKYKDAVSFLLVNLEGLDKAREFAAANRLKSTVWHGAGVPPEAYGIRYVPHKTLIASTGSVVTNFDDLDLNVLAALL
ncbi:unnamed protein product [Symbiodinium pilosum]|uniref:PPM-type phosphatase domain-containing protein n=1 Tax=Symbiodinium pilosum TaxID=2952 RepID=A0A812NQ01_SYMPI|nr:unnamed protein product [Symbiodinium pilosum]